MEHESPHVESGESGIHESSNTRAAFGVAGAAVVVILAIVLWYFLSLGSEEEPIVTPGALEQLQSIGGNPVKETESVNPVEKTNPFNNSYKNPFE